MTELKNKVTQATKKGFKVTWEAIDRAMSGIILIWALSTVSFFAWRIITPDVINDADKGFWGFVTLMVTSLFVIIHARIKK